MTRLLVTGATGMLGRDVVARAANRLDYEVTALARSDLDVTSAQAIAAALERVRPEAIINCAAWTDVDGAESAEAAALAVNATAAAMLAAASDRVGAHLVHVSTDYVFDGAARTPYVESDRTGPVSAYGRTKLAGERAVLAGGGGHAVVRSSWLFGVNGRNFARTMLSLARDGREQIDVVYDQIGCPTYTGHLAEALIELVDRGGSGIHHIAGGGQCSWKEFAIEIFTQAAVDCRVGAITSAEFPRPARRPAWSVLGTERPAPITLPSWRSGLTAFLADSGELVAR